MDQHEEEDLPEVATQGQGRRCLAFQREEGVNVDWSRTGNRPGNIRLVQDMVISEPALVRFFENSSLRNSLVHTVLCGLTGDVLDSIIWRIGSYLQRGRLSQGPALILVALHSPGRILSVPASEAQAGVCSGDVRRADQSAYSIQAEDTTQHVHILHDCNWTLNKCRCQFTAFFRDIRGSSRHDTVVTFYGNERRCAATVAYTAVGRSRRLLYLVSSPARVPEGFVLLQTDVLWHCRRDENRAAGRGLVEAEEEGDTLCSAYVSREGSSTGVDQLGPTTSGEHTHGGEGGKAPVEKVNTLILKMLKEYLPVPLVNVVLLKEFTSHPKLQLVNRNHKGLNEVVGSFERMLHSATFQDLVEIIDQAPSAKFQALNRPVDLYGDLNENVVMVKKLILHQNQNDLDAAKTFLRIVVAVLDRELPKLNTLYLVGPSNAGKSLFVQMLASFCISVGTLRVLNRSSGSFPTQDCVDKRVIVWEEPNYDEAEFGEFLKQLLGGGQINSAIKFSKDCAIPRTPVLITSNKMLFSKDPAWNSRIHRCVWYAAPFLGEFGYQLHPLSFLRVLRDWNIIE